MNNSFFVIPPQSYRLTLARQTELSSLSWEPTQEKENSKGKEKQLHQLSQKYSWRFRIYRFIKKNKLWRAMIAFVLKRHGLWKHSWFNIAWWVIQKLLSSFVYCCRHQDVTLALVKWESCAWRTNPQALFFS